MSRPVIITCAVTGGAPLMQALAQRETTRTFADKAMPMQTLSNLLWAAFGVNRPRSVMPGLGRTAPSGQNSQDIEIYRATADGLFTYDAENNLLKHRSDNNRDKEKTGAHRPRRRRGQNLRDILQIEIATELVK